MPNYSYLAKSFSGQPLSGVKEVENEHELAKILRQEGYILISAELQGQPKKRKFSFSIPFRNRVSLVEKVMFTRNLRVMIGAGISFPRALKTLAAQTKSKNFQKVLTDIAEEISQGKSLFDVFAKYPAIFSELFCNMIKVGEESGTLEDVLGVLAAQMEGEYELKAKVKGAMIYPAVIFTAMVLVGTLMLIVVVPKLAETFADLKIQLPLTTRIVIAIGNFLARFWYLLPIFIFLIVFSFRTILKTPQGKSIFDNLVLRLPIIGSIAKKTNAAYTTRTLGSLISSGVPLVRSLEIVSRTLSNVHYKTAIGQAVEQVKRGAKLSVALAGYEHLYPLLVVQMIAVGEESGSTSEILQKLAGFFEEEVDRATKNLSSVIEPVLMLVIGAVVGFFAISMIQPMYSMAQAF